MIKSGTITNNGTWGITNYNFLQNVSFDDNIWTPLLPMVTFMNISRLRPCARREYLALANTGFEKP
jgi:hypothetical protein